MLHATRPEHLDAILRDGLRAGMPPELTGEVAWVLQEYGVNPVFLAWEDSEFWGAFREGPWRDRPVLEVDVRWLPLVADLASLVDAGGRYSEGRIIWAPGREPLAMRPYLDEWGGIEVEHLLDPGTGVCRAAITLTGTAACLEDIPPERLSLVPAPAPAP